VTTTPRTVRQLLDPVLAWLARGGTTGEVVVDYWIRRRALMEMGEAFDGPAATLLSQIDTAMDAYSPDPDPDQIDEPRLRRELGHAIEALRRLGFLA
jgi:hypothetical protein